MDEIAIRQFLTQWDAVSALPRDGTQLDALRLIIATHQAECLAFWGEMFTTVHEARHDITAGDHHRDHCHECQDFDKFMNVLRKLVSMAMAPTHTN